MKSPADAVPSPKYNDPMSNLLHLGQRERERLQERRDQVYDELQRLMRR